MKNKRRINAVWIMFGLAAIMGALLLVSQIFENAPEHHTFSDYEIHMMSPFLSKCGDAFIFHNKDGAVLIDTGETADQKALLSALEECQVEGIDAMILTHYDKDHIGGAPAVLNKYHVKKCYLTVGEEESPEYKALQKSLEKTGTEQILLTEMTTFESMGASFTIYPPAGLDFRKDPDNNLSMITSVTMGNTALLFAGDAKQERMDQFFERQYDGADYQFLKVPHHGREKKVIKNMLQYFSPKAALITSSEDEPEKDSVTELLKDNKTEVFLTRDGPVSMVFDDKHIEIIQNKRKVDIETGIGSGSSGKESSGKGSVSNSGSKEHSDFGAASATPVIINEIGTDGSKEGVWLELYNRSDRNIQLDQYALSDHKNKLFRYIFPEDTTISAQDFMLVNIGEKEDAGMLSTGEAFTLSRSETLYLSKDGIVVDSMLMPLWTNTKRNNGRVEDGGEKTGPLGPTPGSTNADASPATIVDAPQLSLESGFYDKECKLSITSPEGTGVYYTLDGSDPDRDSKKYTGEITLKDVSANKSVYSIRTDFAPYVYGTAPDTCPHVTGEWYSRYTPPYGNVDKCTVVRAVAIDGEGNKSDISTGSYFIGYQNKKGYSGVPVMSIVSDPEGLFSSERGIMVNGIKYEEELGKPNAKRLTDPYRSRIYCNTFRGRGREWEREIHMDYFGEDGELIFSQEAGIRLHGNQTRVINGNKSFNLYARKDYSGTETFKASFFDTGLLSDKVTLMKGNDIRNYYFSKKMSTESIPTQDYSMVQLFLDGEYWGLYAIQERYVSKKYMQTHYNLDRDEYNLAKGSSVGFDIKNGNPYAIKSSFRVLRDYAQNQDMSDPVKYARLCRMMDMDSYIRSYAGRIYTGDQDWNYFKNQFMLYSDNRWHWIIYDMDAGAGDREIGMPEVNTFTSPRLIKKYSLANDELFPYLMKSPEFCARFTAIFMDLANDLFSEATVTKEMTDFKKKYGEAGLKSIYRYPANEDFHRENRADDSRFSEICDTIIWYFQRRPGYVIKYMKDYFGLKGDPAKVTIHHADTGAGKVKINTITPQPDKSGMWSGNYFTDYPVTVKALPEEGYRFAGWEIEKGKGKPEDAAAEETKVSFTGNVTIRPKFEKDSAIDIETKPVE